MLARSSAEHDDGLSHDISGVRMNKNDDEQLEREVNTLEIGNEAHSRWLTFAKTYLEFGFKMAQVNFAGSEQDGFGPPVAPRSKLPIWSRAAELYFYYFFSKLIVTGLLHLNYELTNEEFKRVAGLNSSSSNDTSYWPLRQEKEAELVHAIELVELVGNPLYEIGVPVDILILLVVCAGLHFYLEIRIYNYFCGPIMVQVARLFLDPKLERELMVRDELQPLIDNIVQSAVNWSNVNNDNLVRSRLRLASQKELAQLPKRLITDSLHKRLSELKISRKENAKIWRNLLESGELDPLNRQPRWTRLIATIYTALVLICTASGYLIYVFLLIWVPYSGWLGDVKLHFGWSGSLITLEALVCCPLQIQWLVFPSVLMTTNTLDQIVYATELKRFVSNLVVDIAAKNYQLVEEKSKSSGSDANRQLMRVLIQYRLFKQQLFSIQPLLGFISFNIITILLLAPALMRIYATHLSSLIRHVLMMFCLFIIGMIDILVMPTCYLYARCLELYRALSYLLARLDHAVSQHQCNQVTCDTSQGLHLDRHTLSLLRRELHMPEFATQQFAINAHFMQVTYSSLMAANFYCGLWLVPMLMRNTSGLTSGTSALLDILP